MTINSTVHHNDNDNDKLVNYHTPENKKIRNMNDKNITNIPKLFKEQ